TNAAISAAVPGRPGPRFALPSYFLAISFRCHPSSVSGVTMVATWLSNLWPESLRPGCQSPALVICETHSAVTNMFSGDAIFINQVVEDVLLMLVHPASKRDYEKRERLEHRMHYCRLSCKVQCLVFPIIQSHRVFAQCEVSVITSSAKRREPWIVRHG